jgi:signal transduction histidine kinase
MERTLNIAKKLKENKEKALEMWELRARKNVLAAKEKDRTAIRNTIPALFDRIIQTLSKKPPKRTANLEKELDVAKEHGEQRAKLQDYTLDQVVHEYQLLRQVILEVLETEELLEKLDRDVILDAISLAERKATLEFSTIRQELERNVKERTRERDEIKQEHNRSQIQVQDLKIETQKRETFVSTLSHDLRTPLTAARMNVELLMKQKADSNLIEVHGQKVLENLDRLDSMIRDLLDANRIKAGEMLHVSITEVDLGHFLAKILDELTAIYGKRFTLESSASIRGFWDPSLLRRSIENLCINAVKYGSKTHPITITCEELPHAQVKISVHNWKSVISEEAQKSLFHLFQRNPSVHSTSQKGWGIGLVLVRGMVDAHGGKIEVNSSEESGTVFHLYLPLDTRSFQYALKKQSA